MNKTSGFPNRLRFPGRFSTFFYSQEAAVTSLPALDLAVLPVSQADCAAPATRGPRRGGAAAEFTDEEKTICF